MKKFIALLLALVCALPLFSSCSDEPEVIRVWTLNGTTGFGMAKMMDDNNDNELYEFAVKSDASDVTAALIAGDVDIAALPTNAAANVYNKTNGGVKILAVNTLGCLYVVAKDGVTVNSIEDLRGKTVYAPAQNPTFIFTDICKKNNLTPGTDITIDSASYAKPDALRDALATGAVEIAVLPEPMVTIAVSKAKTNNVTLSVALDLSTEWDRVNTPGSLVQGCVVVRTEFLEEYPEAVEEFLAEYKKSVKYVNENPADAAQKIETAGIFAQAAIAEKAIPKCNVAYLDGADMKAKMEVYLRALMEINPAAIGGELPDADFYYEAQ